jgi:hypothetical protein
MRQQRGVVPPPHAPGLPQNPEAPQRSEASVHGSSGFRQRHVPCLHFLLQQSLFLSHFRVTALQAAAASSNPSQASPVPRVLPASTRRVVRRERPTTSLFVSESNRCPSISSPLD